MMAKEVDTRYYGAVCGTKAAIPTFLMQPGSAIRREEETMTVDFYAFVEAAEQRKRELGIVETADDVEAMRNRGGNRTQAKRDLLGRMQERAQKADQEAVRAYF
jgi:hypothetical protein